jgi:hypothetical protein
MVDQVHDRRPGGEGAGERQAVLDVDDEGGAVPPHVGQGSRVDAHAAAVAHHPDAVHLLLGRRRSVGGAEQGDAQAGGRQALRHAVDVAFGTPAFGVSDVPPVDEQDVDRR